MLMPGLMYCLSLYNTMDWFDVMIVYAYQCDETALHFACYCGYIDIATLLLYRGANIEAKNKVSSYIIHNDNYIIYNMNAITV